MDQSNSKSAPPVKSGNSSLKRVAEGLYRNSSSGAYFAHFRLKGHVWKENLNTTDLAVAKRALRDLRAQKEHIDPQAGNLSVKEITERHMELLGTLSRSSITKKKGIAKAVYEKWPGGKDVSAQKVRPSDVEEWLQTCTAGKRNSTRNEFLFFIKGVFARAVRDGVLAKSPVIELKPEKRQAILRLTPTVEQFQEIVKSIREYKINHWHAESSDFVEFMGAGGLGNGEVAAIKVCDVDIKKNQIRIRRQKTDAEFYIPIFPRLRPLVEKLLQQAGKEPDARLLSVNEAKHSLESACERLGYAHFTQRSLRRMFITDALERGVDVKTISDWQGHKDGGKLILDTYAHVRRVHHDRMAELMT